MNNADMPAMPIGEQIDGINMNPNCNGLTKREMIAMNIMANIAWKATDSNSPQHYEHAAASAVSMADALLKELNK